jgi:hypothetical protein
VLQTKHYDYYFLGRFQYEGEHFKLKSTVMKDFLSQIYSIIIIRLQDICRCNVLVYAQSTVTRGEWWGGGGGDDTVHLSRPALHPA